MILNCLLGALATLSLVLTLWQWLVARRFPLHRRSAALRIGENQSDSQGNAPNRSSALLPPVTLLKPLKGCDEHTEACLRSWLAQEYAGEVQILFGIDDDGDPAGGLVKKLLVEFPQRDAQLLVCPERLGANAKVSKLAHLEMHVKHEILVVSDADVLVPADLLANVVLPRTPSLSSPAATTRHRGESEEKSVADGRASGDAHQIGLVSCFYQLANPTTLAMRSEAIAINADFWSQVLQSRSLRPLDFALGAVMVMPRKLLAEIGGFRALVDCVADDYQLGHRLARRGHRIGLCPVVVECRASPMNWRQVWQHQLRWARTIRVCKPLPYFFSILSNATLWPGLWFVIQPSLLSGAACVGFLFVRIAAAGDLQHRLTQASGHVGHWWLVPGKDLLQVALWVLAFTGNQIVWHGERYRLRRDGTFERR